MSIFEKITGEIKTAELERVRLEAVTLAVQLQARDKFKVDFVKVWKSIAKPAFDAFVSDAKAHGYDAKVVEHGVNTSKYGGTVFLMPVVGTDLSSNAQTYLRLSGEPFDQVVELGTSFDLHGAHKYDLEFIRRDRLEAALEEFLRSALRSAPPAEISQPPTLVVSLKDVMPRFDVTSIARINEA